MSTLIVGTAGHIDHGKSALVRALTGTDPDRLREEKERGITIDLGFASTTLDDGPTLSFVDVPGHERFVRNMLAGAHGIDAVLLVVAADESVMPQTREHFEICRLLDTARGCIALSKCDLADEETQAITELEVRELIAGSFLEGAPIVRTSAQTGAGLAELRRVLASLAPPGERPALRGVTRLPVDRVFTMRGFGTVVTGTLVGGAISVGDPLELLPRGGEARVRGLQVHGDAVERVDAGNRTAVNLAGLEPAAISRGDVLAAPGTLRATSMLDVTLQLLKGERPLRDQARVRVHVASAEVLARVRLLEADRLEPGATALAQLRLETPTVAGRGDRLVLRAYSPTRTIAGARVLDPLPPRRGRRDAGSLRRDLAELTPPEAAIAFLEAAGASGVSRQGLAARVTCPASVLGEAVSGDPRAAALPAGWIATRALEELVASVEETLRSFHRAHPLEGRMSLEELRQRACPHAAQGAYEAVLERLEGSGRLRRAGEGVAHHTHSIALSPEEEAARAALAVAARDAGLSGLDMSGSPARGVAPDVVRRVTRVMLASGELRRVGGGLLVHGEALEAFKGRVRERWPAGSRVDVGEIKALTGLSRKYVIPLLEYLDAERVTRRNGATRTVIG